LAAISIALSSGFWPGAGGTVKKRQAILPVLVLNAVT
jgi:hypothetical protein